MSRALGAALLVVGAILLVMGINASESVASDFSRFFTGQMTDRAAWMLVGGAGAAVFGIALTVFNPGGGR